MPDLSLFMPLCTLLGVTLNKLFAGEPTGALDSHATRQLLDTFAMLCREYSATILMVTHDVMAASYCDRIFFLCFVCSIGCICGMVLLPEVYAVCPTSAAAIPLLISVFAFYKWAFGWLYAKRRMKSLKIYQKDMLYIMANITSRFKTPAIVNTIFCTCFLFSACSFVTGILMLQPEFPHFSILSLLQIIAFRQNSKSNQIIRCMGKSDKQIERLVNQQIAIKLTSPMIMALLVILPCIPLLNGKMNFLLPVSLNNILLKLTGAFGACIIFFYICYFKIASALTL